MDIFVTKLGTFKKQERSRIWIEGDRLVKAGFTPGALYAREYLEADGHQASIVMTLLDDDDVITAPPLKVASKGDCPIIDITGKRLREHFAGFTHVSVSYFAAGHIIILGTRPMGTS